jgi:outer membrane protein OmpA-like peptidoglycan-associated protein
MSDAVARLKQLLFEPENEAIASLSGRIDAVFDRAGTTERFQASVAAVLDGALRDAEVARHAEVAAAIAPLIVKTVKTEIHNSQDELVEVLYPATGRMVKAYVASAIKDLTDQINRRLTANPIMLRLNALTSGRSVGELAIAASQKLVVDDVFLIKRSTGELIGRWPAPSGNDAEDAADLSRDQVMSGVVTAINEFATEAFKAEGSALRQIDLGEALVYLRVSPTFLLVAKCSGSGPPGAEHIIDDEFLKLIDDHRAVLDGTARQLDGGDVASMLKGVSSRLETRIATWYDDQDVSGAGGRPIKILATLILVPLLAWMAWSAYGDYATRSVRAIATNIVQANVEMRGYPVEFRVADRGTNLVVAGLVPNQSVKTSVIDQIKAVLPDVLVQDQLTALPLPPPAPPPVELPRAKQPSERETATLAAATQIVQANSELRGYPIDLRVGDLGASLAVVGLVPNQTLKTGLIDQIKAALPDVAIQDHLSAIPVPPPVEFPRVRQLSDREQLILAARGHAIFFGDGTQFRDPVQSSRTLDELAALMARDTSLVRVVGYTDGTGTPAANAALAQARAESVIAGLVQRGVARTRLVALARTTPEYNIASGAGSGSANRRVEFEIGFVEERAD